MNVLCMHMSATETTYTNELKTWNPLLYFTSPWVCTSRGNDKHETCLSVNIMPLCLRHTQG